MSRRRACVQNILRAMCGAERMEASAKIKADAEGRRAAERAERAQDWEVAEALKEDMRQAQRGRASKSVSADTFAILQETLRRYEVEGRFPGYHCAVYELQARLQASKALEECVPMLQRMLDGGLPSPPAKLWQQLLYKASVNQPLFKQLLGLCLEWGEGVGAMPAPLAEVVAKGYVTLRGDPHTALQILRHHPEVEPGRRLVLSLVELLPPAEAAALLRSALFTATWGLERGRHPTWVSAALLLSTSPAEAEGFMARWVATGCALEDEGGEEAGTADAGEGGVERGGVPGTQNAPACSIGDVDEVRLTLMDVLTGFKAWGSVMEVYKAVVKTKEAHVTALLRACEAGCVERGDVYYATACSLVLHRDGVPITHPIAHGILRLAARFGDAAAAQAVLDALAEARLPAAGELGELARRAGAHTATARPQLHLPHGSMWRREYG
eukprot:TRINITY_DN3499_c0_g2_i1.p1 TRINITY_DN3499_c0_g2~~TRINITY_DN3499_c0_g2_i1.p1  ORF type:complete len:442 (+),score=132.97 TRINITY_DN3499_c0_g2_i1:67-1392(+)